MHVPLIKRLKRFYENAKIVDFVIFFFKVCICVVVNYPRTREFRTFQSNVSPQKRKTSLKRVCLFMIGQERLF